MTRFFRITIPLLSPTILPQHWDLDNYHEVLTASGLSFVRLSMNSIAMTLGRTIGQLVFCSLAAFAFARIRFPARGGADPVYAYVFRASRCGCTGPCAHGGESVT